MTSDVVASALAGLGPMMMQGQRKPVDKYAARRQFGDALLMQGAQATPLRGGVAEGLARAGQAVLGGYLASNADTEQKAEDEANSQALIEAIAKSQTRGPDGQMSFDPSPVAQALAKTNPGMAAYLQMLSLMQNQQTQSRQATATTLFGPGPAGAAPAGGGAPGNYPDRIQATESPNGATNPQSGASGFYQFMPDTAHGLAQRTAWGRGLSRDQVMQIIRDEAAAGRKDKQQELLGLYNQASDAALQQAGIPANDVTRFALHAFGPAGGVSLLRAPDNMPVAEWVRSVNWGRATPEEVVAQNNLGKYQTVGQLRQDFIARRIGGGQPQPGQPQPAAPVAPQRPVQLAQAGGMPDVTSTQFGQMPVPMQGAAPQTAGPPPVQAPPPEPTMPQPPDVPRPALPPADAARLRQAVASGALTAQQAQAEAARIQDGLWQRANEQAKMRYTADMERWKSDREAGAVKIKDVDALRKEIAKLPQVDALVTVTPIFNSMQNAAKINSKAADLDLIYGLGKILDPGSVVREGEMVLVQRTGGIFDQMKGWLSAMEGGAALPPDVRASILAIANSRVGELKKSADAAIEPYRGVIQRRGWNEADVMPGLPQITPFNPRDAGISTTPRPSASPAPPPRAGRQYPTPPAEAIADLKRQPGTKAQFDEIFGPGAADRALGGR